MVSSRGRDLGRETGALEAEILGCRGRKVGIMGACAGSQDQGGSVDGIRTRTGTDDG